MSCTIIALGIFSFVNQVLGQTRVTGTVRDSSGTAMADAFVEAVPRTNVDNKGAVGDRPNAWVPAGSDGRFVITLPPGRFKIRAKDEASGYPDPVYWLNSDPTAVFPEIEATAQNKQIEGVQVRLGKKGGLLAGQLLDQRSGDPVARGRINLRDVQNPDAYVDIFSDTKGHFEFAVPSKPIIVSASAAGFRSTLFAHGAQVFLAAGERRSIIIELQHE